jgi:hypothetical protein
MPVITDQFKILVETLLVNSTFLKANSLFVIFKLVNQYVQRLRYNHPSLSDIFLCRKKNDMLLPPMAEMGGGGTQTETKYLATTLASGIMSWHTSAMTHCFPTHVISILKGTVDTSPVLIISCGTPLYTYVRKMLFSFYMSK